MSVLKARMENVFILQPFCVMYQLSVQARLVLGMESVSLENTTSKNEEYVHLRDVYVNQNETVRFEFAVDFTSLLCDKTCGFMYSSLFYQHTGRRTRKLPRTTSTKPFLLTMKDYILLVLDWCAENVSQLSS